MLWFFNDYAVAQYNTLAYWVYMDISGKKRPVETIPGMGMSQHTPSTNNKKTKLWHSLIQSNYYYLEVAIILC
jgi:hypothetical protein